MTMYPTARAIQQTIGLETAQAVELTQGLEPSFIDPTNDSLTFTQPAPLPITTSAPANYQVTLSNQLARQVAQFYELLFPIVISSNPGVMAQNLLNVNVLNQNQPALLQKIAQVQQTILVINQLTQGPPVTAGATRIPSGYSYTVTNPDSETIAGLSTAANPNAVLNRIQFIILDLEQYNFTEAQSDYAILRNLLQPYWGF